MSALGRLFNCCMQLLLVKTLVLDPLVTLIRADQNTSGALLEFPMKTAMQGKSHVSSAISACDN